MGQADGKYWIANNPNAQITDSQAQKLAGLSGSELDVLEIVGDISSTAAEIDANCDVLTEAVTTTNVIAASETGTHFVLNSATAFVSTLPAPAAGLQFWFHAGATQVTGGNHTIVTNGSANVIEGTITCREVSALVACVAAADTISFIADLAVQGDLAHVWSDGTDWYLDGHCFVQDGMTTTQAS
tara:strand:+ start:167 stop:721 length:555 start_codon:yes stop_codon:yes gene_type:complete